ncbi:beta-ketoacyl-[acyl-carrier-protein] synthase family protein [Streptomyces eurocidicus]|uniref:beta-ketoacyl-[acyl-carrier-protein] synthase family protein n=1 Tax=Streptomyces eurocidicus TaxID=66423 RepID=UPI001E5109C8|nr:beta-ketoacyl-[acyl-carrier-protein] synthase family protein [Streptomyces eurocidicus]
MDGTSRKIRHVVITAVGAVTAHGIGAEALWKGSLDGTVAIRPVEAFAEDGSAPRIGGEVPEFPVPAYDYPAGLGGAREPALDFALTAAQEALAASGLTGIPRERWGIAFGSCNGGTRSGELALSRARGSGETDGNPFQPLLVSPHALAEALSAAFDIQGPVLSVNTACASGAHALAHALEVIRGGRADAMLVGGSDAFTETAFAGFTSLQSLSARPAAPYSRDRDGLSLGEGSGMLVLAEESVAQRCGAPVLAKLIGYGLSADGYHATAPHPEGEGASRAIRGAMRSSGVSADDIGYINGHGTGTRKNDEAESNAVRAALGEAAEKTPLSSTKSTVGHRRCRGGRRHRPGPAGPDAPAHGRVHRCRPQVRSGQCAVAGTTTAHGRRPVQQLRLRRRQCHRRFRPAGHLGACPARSPGRERRRDRHRRGHGRRPGS